MSEAVKRPEEFKTEEIKVEEVRAEETKAEEVKAEEFNVKDIKAEESMKDTPEGDLSKIKIRHVLGQRIKNYGTRKIVVFLTIAVIFFSLGFLTDRLIIKNGAGRRFIGNKGTEQRIPGNFKSNRKSNAFDNKNAQKPEANSSASKNKTQETKPAEGQQ